LSLIGALLLGGLTSRAGAQLSPKDLDELRERAKREGWTFEIRESEGTRRPAHELCGTVMPPDLKEEGIPAGPPTIWDDLPAAFDWRDYGACTPIRNQGPCGSCWAFGAVASVESAIAIYDGLLVDLSEQWLVSCTDAGSCSGGWPTSALEFMRCAGAQDPCGDWGAVLEVDFPYRARDLPCGCPYDHPYWIDNWRRVQDPLGSGGVERIKQAIYQYGPVVACVYVNNPFFAYGGGIFNACEDGPINHAIALVGWDDTQGREGVWILRNSWGPGWGEDGYMRIEYGCNDVGTWTCYVVYRRDCNDNGIPDQDELDQGLGSDCNANCVLDECDVTNGNSPDCNGNQVPDECDLAEGTSADCNGSGVPDECELDGTGSFDLHRTLLRLSANSAAISALIPDRFDFTEGETGHEIVDGGDNMYDGGNQLNTDRAELIPYTNGVVVAADSAFGPGSHYFTAKYPGLFVLAAADVSLDFLAVRGDLGADGSGQAQGEVLTTVVDDREYTVFVKRVFDAPTPSVNHLFIVPGTSSDVSHSFSEDTNRDRHRLNDRAAVLNELIYVLVARQNGLFLENADVLNIANALLSQVVYKPRDCNGNLIPDECELPGADLNLNGTLDECECLGDLDGDLDVDLGDLAVLLSHYGMDGGARITEGDLDYDGDVDLTDLSMMLAVYGSVCP